MLKKIKSPSVWRIAPHFVSELLLDGEIVPNYISSNDVSRIQTVATIGNFDGVHLGHQQLLKYVIDVKVKLQKRLLSAFTDKSCDTLPTVKSVVILFEPQPLEFMIKNKAPCRIMSLRQKIEAIKAYGIDDVVCLKFNETLKAHTPEQFVQNILMKQLYIKQLVIGDDFQFGAGRRGNFELFQRLGKKLGFETQSINTVCLDKSKASMQINAIPDVSKDAPVSKFKFINGIDILERRVSSTLVRQCLQHNDFKKAQVLLGKPYSITGKVSHGKKLGRTIGKPTANIILRHEPMIKGVFAAFVAIDRLPSAFFNQNVNKNGKLQFSEMVKIQFDLYPCVVNVGVNPTVSEGKTYVMEAHILCNRISERYGLNGLYGKRLHVIPQHKIRNEKKFNSIDALKAQINEDIAEASKVLQC